MMLFTEVKIVFPFLIGIVLLSAIAARPSPQENGGDGGDGGGNEGKTIRRFKKTGGDGGGGGGGESGSESGSQHVHRTGGKTVTHVHKTSGGGGGGGGGGDGEKHVHKTGGGGDGEEHVHHTRGGTKTNVHHTRGGTKTNVHHFGGDGGDGGGNEGAGPGVNTVPHEGGVGGPPDLTPGINTVPHENGNDTSKVIIQDPAKYNSFINDGKSFLERTDVRRRNICNRGIIDKTATKLRNGLTNGVNKLEQGIAKLTSKGKKAGPIGALLYDAGKGVRNLANNAVDGIDFGIQDAACGLGNIADDIAAGLGSGNLFSNAGDIIKEFFGGLGNIAIDVASEAGEGVGRAASNVKSFGSKLDGKRKTKYKKSSP